MIKVSKVYAISNNSVVSCSSEGFACVIKYNFSFINHCSDTIAGGDCPNDQDVVEFFISAAPWELIQMYDWGQSIGKRTVLWQ